MAWPHVALGCGPLVLLAAFAFGTENQLSTAAMDPVQDCGPAISASWLVSGTPDQLVGLDSSAIQDERRTAAACRPEIRQARVLVLTTMGMGDLLTLVGWTAVRARGEAEPPGATPARAQGDDGPPLSAFRDGHPHSQEGP